MRPIWHEDYYCLKFLDSLSNHKRTDHHMWDKYVALGTAFVLGNTMAKRLGERPIKMHDIVVKYFIYPPGGEEGRKAAFRVMNHV